MEQHNIAQQMYNMYNTRTSYSLHIGKFSMEISKGILNTGKNEAYFF